MSMQQVFAQYVLERELAIFMDQKPQLCQQLCLLKISSVYFLFLVLIMYIRFFLYNGS